MTLKELEAIFKDSGLGKTAFAQEIGISRVHFNRILDGYPISAKVEAAAERYVEVTRLNIEHGIAEPYPPYKTQAPYRKAAAGRTVSSNFRVHLRGLLATIVEDLPEDTYEVFEVDGASMITTLAPGDKILCKADSIENMIDNRVYVLVTDDPTIINYNGTGIWIKRCAHRAKNGYISCRSDNLDSTEAFNTFRLKTNTIKEVWYPVLKITPHLSDPNRDVYIRLDELEGRIEILEDDINVLPSE
jgi:hypothetical protein